MKKVGPSLYLLAHAIVAFLCGAITGLPIVFVVGFLFLVAAFFAHRLLNEDERAEQPGRGAANKAVADVPADKEAELTEQVEHLQKAVDGLTEEIERLRKLEPSGPTKADADEPAPAPTQNQAVPSKSTPEQKTTRLSTSVQAESNRVAASEVEVIRTGSPAKAAPAVEKKKAKADVREGSFGPLWSRLEDGLLRIGGQGEMPFGSRWNKKEVTEVVIEEGVLSIGMWAFSDCTNLSRVTLPKSLKEIGRGAFERTGIRELELPRGLVSIGMLAFDETPLKELEIPDSVTDIIGPLFSEEPTFPIRLPKGREHLPVTPRLRDENCLHKLADSFFGDRGDVLLDPTGDPHGDRYTAVRQLLVFVREYLHKEVDYLDRSRVSEGKLFFCCDVDYETRAGDCYDGGGNGPETVDIERGVYIRVMPEEDFRQKAAKWNAVQEEPFPMWRDASCRVGLLERPLGLSNFYEISSVYPIHLPEQL